MFHIRIPNSSSVVVPVGCSRAFQLRMLSGRRTSVVHNLPQKRPLQFGEFNDLPVCITEFLKLFACFTSLSPIFYFYVSSSHYVLPPLSHCICPESTGHTCACTHLHTHTHMCTQELIEHRERKSILTENKRMKRTRLLTEL